MMDTVHKQVIYGGSLAHDNSVTLSMPKGSEVICAAQQNDELAIWYRFHMGAADGTRRIYVVGTGFEVPDHATYVGTAFFYEGKLVFHVFDGGEIY